VNNSNPRPPEMKFLNPLVVLFRKQRLKQFLAATKHLGKR